MAKDMCTNSDAIDSEHYCNIEQTECIDKTRIDVNSSWTDVKARIKRNECIQIHIQKHEN